MAELVVGIGDCRVSKNPEDVLITHALGSCIAVLIHDPAVNVGGMLHYLLPESQLDATGAITRPLAYADTGIPMLLQMVSQLGAVKSRMVVIAVGGAQMMDPHGTFNIGKRNRIALVKTLWRANLVVHREEIGGTSSRTVRMDVGSGRVRLRTSGELEQELVVKPRWNGQGKCGEHSYRK